jgi:hypothetical protein
MALASKIMMARAISEVPVMRPLVSFGIFSAVVAATALCATKAFAHPEHPGNPKSHGVRQFGSHPFTKFENSRLHRRHKTEPPPAGSVNPVL